MERGKSWNQQGNFSAGVGGAEWGYQLFLEGELEKARVIGSKAKLAWEAYPNPQKVGGMSLHYPLHFQEMLKRVLLSFLIKLQIVRQTTKDGVNDIEAESRILKRPIQTRNVVSGVRAFTTILGASYKKDFCL